MPRKSIETEMVKISVRISRTHVEKLRELVKGGEYADISETIRAAIREFLKEKGGERLSDRREQRS